MLPHVACWTACFLPHCLAYWYLVETGSVFRIPSATLSSVPGTGGLDQAADVLSAGESHGQLDEQVNRSMGWFRSLGHREVYRGLYRVDVPLIPEGVLREALVNAEIHRDYAIAGSQVLLEVFDDRIVVTSPGALPNHMTVEQERNGGSPPDPGTR